jgi:hypothetical protein
MQYIGKITNLAYQGLREKLFTKNATKQELTWLSSQVTMVCASSIPNFFNLDTIFGVYVHLSMPYNFHN